MDTRILGRDIEMRIFEKLLNSNEPKFMAMYGRRRVGKTFLIREYFKQHIQFAFTGSFEESTKNQLDNFFGEYITRTKGKKETSKPKNWNTAFAYLADYLYTLKGRKKKTVVFIDELPWLDRPKSGFITALEYFWNQHVSQMDHVILIVCGSAASWMQRKLMKSKGGLHNRITNRIKLEPFTLQETEAFLKYKKIKLSRYHIIQLYMVMGGIPFYLNELTTGKSSEQLINELCFNPTGLLSNEYEQLYYSLFKNADKHMRIIEALAASPNGMNREILINKSKLGDGGILTRAITDLYESGFIVKQLPFNKKKKDTIYKLIDLYSLFYIKFIKGNITKDKNRWQKIANTSSFKAWSGYAYENICILHSEQILFKLGLRGTYTEISSWRFAGNKELSGTQIDMLINRKDGIVNLCEAKFTEKEFIVTKDYSTKLRQRRAIFEHVSKTKKAVVTTLISTFPAIKNEYYFEEINSEVEMEDLFVKL